MYLTNTFKNELTCLGNINDLQCMRYMIFAVTIAVNVLKMNIMQKCTGFRAPD